VSVAVDLEYAFVSVTKYCKKELKGEKLYFDSWFQSIVGWLRCFSAVIRQKECGERAWQSKVAYLMVGRK
jgi:hypothetical protein